MIMISGTRTRLRNNVSLPKIKHSRAIVYFKLFLISWIIVLVILISKSPEGGSNADKVGALRNFVINSGNAKYESMNDVVKGESIEQKEAEIEPDQKSVGEAGTGAGAGVETRTGTGTGTEIEAEEEAETEEEAEEMEYVENGEDEAGAETETEEEAESGSEDVVNIPLINYPDDPDCRPSHKDGVQKVHLLSNAEEGSQSEYRHIIMDGVEKSSRLTTTDDVNDPDALWIVDEARFDCFDDLIPAIQKRWKYESDAVDLTPRPWKIILMNFDDCQLLQRKCLIGITEIFKSTKYLYYGERKIMQDRDIEINEEDPDDKPFADFGEPIDFAEELWYEQDSGSFVPFHCSVYPLQYGVRSDIVEAIEHLQHVSLMQKLGSMIMPNPVKTNLPKRPKDVAHFWNPDRDTEYAYLRNNVTAALLDFADEPDNTDYIITADEVGESERTGRNAVNENYAAALLSHKIIIVCQRDGWEDHYRLMEALAGGALVMTDPMHPLPAGIEDGKQVVVYESIAALKDKIKYFLEHEEERQEIAQSGHDVAMSRHRSWHRMEELVFGDWSAPHGGAIFQAGNLSNDVETQIL